MDVNNSLTIRINHTRDSAGGSLRGLIGLILLSILLFAGLGGAVYSSLRLSELPLNITALTIIGVLCCIGFSMLFMKKGPGLMFFIATLVLFIVYCLLFRNQIQDAWFLTVNQVMDTLCLRYGRIFPVYSVT